MAARRLAVAVAALAALAAAPALWGLPAPTTAQEQPNRVFLPLAGQQAVLAQLPRASTAMPPAVTPTDAATPTDAPTSTHTPTPTDEPTPTATPFVCGALPDRLTVVDHDLEGTRIRTGGPDFWTTNPIFTARQRGGTLWVGWPDDQGTVHLTPLDDELQRIGDDLTVAGDEIRGLVAHDDGLALLVVKEPVMSFVRLEQDGTERWRKDLVGTGGQGSGASWIDFWPHESRLAWDGRRYAAYVGHTHNFGGRGTHQGDLLWYFDEDGERTTPDEGWNWGCSHSLDVRLAWNAVRFGPVCLSDAYPTKAFHFNHEEKEIRREPSGDGAGSSDARLGGLVATREGFVMSFASPQGSPSRSTDVGVLRIGNDASVSAVTWLTDTPDVHEDGPHLAAYGTGLLATWTDGGAHLAQMLSAAGAPEGEPVALPASIAPKDDLLGGLPGGDVVWAARGPRPGVLRVVRLDYCQPR